MVRFLLVSFLFLCLQPFEVSRPAYASKEANRSAFIKGCLMSAKSSRFDSLVKNNLESNGWSAASVELHFKYQTEVVKNINVLERLCRDLSQIILNNEVLMVQINKEVKQNDGISETSIKMLYQNFTKYFVSGIQRIPSNQLAPYFDFTYSIFNQMPQQLCKQMLSGRLNQEMNSFLLSIQGHLPIETQANYLNLVKNAIFAEINNSPPVSVIDNFEASELNQKFGDYLTEYSLKFDNPYKLAQVLNNLVQGTDEEYCDVGRLYYGALLSMPGRDGDRARKLIINGMK